MMRRTAQFVAVEFIASAGLSMNMNAAATAAIWLYGFMSENISFTRRYINTIVSAASMPGNNIATS